MHLAVIAYDVTEPDSGQAADDALVTHLPEMPRGVLAHAAFRQDRTAVRVVCHDGTADAAVDLLARRDAERLGPLLAGRPARMTCLQSRFIEERPAELAALRYRVRPGNEERIRAVFADVRAEA